MNILLRESQHSDIPFFRRMLDEASPVLAIAVHSDYRHQGIGEKMIEWLIDYASKHAIQKISLSVSKDNYALNLYKQQGFQEYADKGEAFIMVRTT
jgi:ribosomal protein S18 acetylase RimI-like enzyme